MNLLSNQLQLIIKRLLIYLVILIPIAAAIIVTTNLRQPSSVLMKKNQTSNQDVDSFMHGLKAKSFDQSGNIEDTVTSNYASHDTEGNIVLQHPYIIAAEDDAPSWHIHALNGKLTGPKQKIVYLWGDVKISQPLGPNSQNITLLTSAMRYDSNKEFATTNEPVTIIQPDSIIHGVGMTADIKHGDIKILHNTNAQYVVHQKTQGVTE